MTSTGRPAFVVWSTVPERAREIMLALDGTARCFRFPGLDSPRSAPLRYALDAVRTLVWLMRERPCVVFASTPPFPVASVAQAYAALAGVPFVLDCHPAAFGVKGDALARWALPITRRTARRAACVLVTTPDWVDEISGWGGRAVVLHEAPPRWANAIEASELAATGSARTRVLFVTRFAADEPVAEAVEVARRLPDLDFRVTGPLARRPAELSTDLPANLQLIGYLRQDEYVAELLSAHVVLGLTTEPTSVMRAACEAVWAIKPLVVSDWPAARRYFPEAIHTANDAESVAAAVQTAVDSIGDVGRWRAARDRQLEKWREQERELRSVLSRSLAPDAVTSADAAA